MPIKRYTGCHGLTLIELLCTLAICGIIFAYGIPALSTFFANNRLQVYSQQLGQFLAFARSEAIQRNGHVVMCPSGQATRCEQSTDWNTGWLVFDDRNGNGSKEIAEPVLRHQRFIETNLTIVSTRRTPVMFFGSGKSPGSNATFTFCDNRGTAHARAVILSNSGRYRMSTAQSDGDPLVCP